MLLRLLGPLAAPIRDSRLETPAGDRYAGAEDEEEEASEAEIQAYLEAGEAAGIFESDEGEIVESLVDFFDTVVREVMTPRTEMVAAADTDDFRDLLRLFAETHKSRIPIYHETVDRIIGVVHVKNLVKHGLRGTEPPITQLTRECLVVPENKPLGDLLRDFQSRAPADGDCGGRIWRHVGSRDPRGYPRRDRRRDRGRTRSEAAAGVRRTQSRAFSECREGRRLDTLDDVFGLEVEEEDVDTVGGLVFSIHGTVPEAGTEVRDDGRGLVFKVEEMDERRIERVTVRRLETETTEGVDPRRTDR